MPTKHRADGILCSASRVPVRSREWSLDLSNSSKLKTSRLVARVFDVLATNGSLAFFVALLFAAVSFVVWRLRLEFGPSRWSGVLLANGIEAALRSFCFSSFVVACAARFEKEGTCHSKWRTKIHLRFLFASLVLSLLEFGLYQTLDESLSLAGVFFLVSRVVEVFTVAWVATAGFPDQKTALDGARRGIVVAFENGLPLIVLVAAPFLAVNLVLIPMRWSDSVGSVDQQWLARGLFAMASCVLAAVPVALIQEMSHRRATLG